MKSSLFVRIFPAVALAILLLCAVNIYRTDTCWYYLDVGMIIEKSLRLADRDELIYDGNPAFSQFNLGPLAHLLAAVPLSLTRDIHYLYYFGTFLFFPAGLLLYFACGRLGMTRRTAVTAAIVFVTICLVLFTRMAPTNTGFLPFFLALYFYFLARSFTRGGVVVVLLWISLGLCMQLNVSAGLLIPATLATLKPRTFRALATHGIGAMLVGVMHFHWAAKLIALVAGTYAGAPVAEPPAPFSADAYWGYVLRWINIPPMFFFSFILILFAMFFNLRGVGKYLRASPIAHGLAAHFVALVFIAPVFNVAKGFFASHYFLPSLPFWSVVAAGAIEASFTGGQGRWKRDLAIAGMFFVQLVPLMRLPPPAPRYFDMERLGAQIAVVERLTNFVKKENLREVVLWEYVCSTDPGAVENGAKSAVRKCTVGHSTYNSLCLYLHPEMYSRLSADPHLARTMLLAHILGRGAAGDPEFDEQRGQVGVLVDQFSAGMMNITVYQMDPREYRQTKLCSWCR